MQKRIVFFLLVSFSIGWKTLVASMAIAYTAKPDQHTTKNKVQPVQAGTFHVIAFFTAKNDLAHISFVHEANQWFAKVASQHDFTYDTTSNWNNLNESFLSKYQVVLFLDTRPEQPAQRAAFETYMRQGGSWMGFHFSAFALNNSEVKNDWHWYHDMFLGSGQYKSNTWRPTSAVLKVEDKTHPVTKGLPATFKAQPNEWYRWDNDLRKNPDIDILVSIDPSSFPLGTGPKPSEIWKSGYYPVVWTNRKYKMIYMNMGHNDMDYEHKFGEEVRTLSKSFENDVQNQLILQALHWLGRKNQKDY